MPAARCGRNSPLTWSRPLCYPPSRSPTRRHRLRWTPPRPYPRHASATPLPSATLSPTFQPSPTPSLTPTPVVSPIVVVTPLTDAQPLDGPMARVLLGGARLSGGPALPLCRDLLRGLEGIAARVTAYF
ncbi:MAG: hypothetical protein R2838_13885 [Caldilineaceae bacterium]